jgi:two-component system chemotaxis response regulator CheY
LPAHLPSIIIPDTIRNNDKYSRGVNPGQEIALKVLVVDDSEAFRKVMIELLVRVGFHDVAEAQDFDEGIAAFRKERPKISFVDMILPGKSGVELTAEMLKIEPKAIIIAMSSIVNKKMIRESLDSGAKDFLLKPTNEIALGSVLAMWSD